MDFTTLERKIQQGKFTDFFLSDTLKTAFSMRNERDQDTFSNQGSFIQFSNEGRGDLPSSQLVPPLCMV